MKAQLKTKLLSTGIFYDNEFLQKYVEVVVDNAINPVLGLTQEHHILPKYFFVDRGMKVDNSQNNLTILKYRDHILAHYYLCRCSIEPEDVGKNMLSIRFLLQGIELADLKIEEIDWDSIEELYRCGREYTYKKSHTIESNKKVSESLLGRPSPNRGNIKSQQIKSKANPNAKNKKLSEIATQRIGDKNPFYGKHHSDDAKKRISDNNRKPVVMRDLRTLETIREFKSIKDASNYLLENKIAFSTSIPNRISRVCNADSDHLCAYGFNWRFIDKV